MKDTQSNRPLGTLFRTRWPVSTRDGDLSRREQLDSICAPILENDIHTCCGAHYLPSKAKVSSAASSRPTLCTAYPQTIHSMASSTKSSPSSQWNRSIYHSPQPPPNVNPLSHPPSTPCLLRSHRRPLDMEMLHDGALPKQNHIHAFPASQCTIGYYR